MKALIHDRTAPHGLRLGDAPEPQPGSSQALIRVSAISLNFGEVAFLADHAQLGEVSGWDAAGTVVAAAAGGSGPPAGARVVTFGWSGAWAQLRAVDAGEAALLPDEVGFEEAAALPVAAVTALRAIRGLGSVLGRTVLVSGASGGVGRFAVQLASRAGARVIATVGSPARAEGLAELGADQVAVGLDGVQGPVDFAIDNVGGPLLGEILRLLAPGGHAMSVGMASLQPTTIDFEQLRNVAGGARVEAFSVGPNFGPDLAYLVSLLRDGELDPQIGWRGPWDRVDEAIEALRSRRVAGKAVLEVQG
jgi:NADPH:quinone reductase-like Zn-dependent oxidoreductase